MNRRDFLKAAAGLAASAAMPIGLPEPFFPRGALNALFDNATLAGGAIGDSYYAFLHPSAMKLWREAYARDRWAIAWRRYRLARRENVCGYLPPATVLERFAPTGIDSQMLDRDHVADALACGEIGTYEGVRFITTTEVPCSKS